LQRNVGDAKTVVINRPMAMFLTNDLGKLVLNGAFQKSQKAEKLPIEHFMLAFGHQCAVYVGGPDEQDQPATMIHGIPELEGAEEISPGSKIYRGGIDAAVNGVLENKYSALEFRFFVGCHAYKESTLDVAVLLGKYQPVACARSVALKQCIALPKPLWHEGMYNSCYSLVSYVQCGCNSYSAVRSQTMFFSSLHFFSPGVVWWRIVRHLFVRTYEAR
jgi:hypothetical protein